MIDKESSLGQEKPLLGLAPGASQQASLERWECSPRSGSDLKCKTDKIRTAWAAGDRIGALRIAARFFDRSPDTGIFKRGMDAYNNPNFYLQIGKEPGQVVGAALDALAKRFGLH